jgi:Fe-S oxidoreductase
MGLVYQALKEVKELFDPDGIMNPGKIVDAPSMLENLRYGTDYHDNPIKSEYLYRKDNTFEDAVHMCSGVGECRKILGGTMCPSYKATRDEEHSTRGRANALRLAMSGQQDLDGLTSSRLLEVLDLCLSCKACKSECPSNVDMAKLKSEVSQLYYDKNGVKLRDKIIKNSTNMAAKMSGNAAGIVNRIQETKLFRNLLEHVAGFDRRRVLPAYAKIPFSKWYDKNAMPVKNGRKKVALFADTYLNYHDTHIGISAYQLLTDCGYEVLLANAGCCQRPKISHGFLREAKKEGLKTVLKLDKFMSKGIPVLVCEPGCASALTDDLPDLIEDEELAKRLNENVFMIDQFLYQEIESGQLNVEFTSDEKEINLHGHCHQKALYGTKPMNEILAKISGLKSKEINSGCCGMAGSFGYEKEHYEISEKIGSEDLFTPIMEMSESTTVVACGFSCRHQIEHFTGRKPKHWVEVIKVKYKLVIGN